MATKRPKPEEIVVKFWQVEVLMGQGMPQIGVIRQIRLTEQTYYRWKEKDVSKSAATARFSLECPSSNRDLQIPYLT